MNLGAVIGLVLGLGILLTAAIMGSADTGGMGSLWDAISMAIVVGGGFCCYMYCLSSCRCHCGFEWISEGVWNSRIYFKRCGTGLCWSC